MNWFEILDARINLAAPKLAYDSVNLNFELTVAEADAFLDYIQLDCSFSRQKKLKRSALKLPEERVYKKLTPTRAGLDLYLCRYANRSPPTKIGVPVRRVGRKCGCLAKARFNFPANYKHTNDGEFNVKEYGDSIVRVSWHWEHNHDTRSMTDFRIAPLTRKMERLVKLFKLNRVGYTDIEEETAKGTVNFDPQNIMDFFKLKRYHLLHELKMHLMKSSSKKSSIKSTLETWTNEIKNKGGMAKFKDFGILKHKSEVKSRESQQNRTWSYSFMSSWQRDVLRRDGETFYFDCNQNENVALDLVEKFYLFTIIVKNSVTKQGCPCAFLITNSPHGLVVSDFLQEVESFSLFEPQRMVIDCNDSGNFSIFPDYALILRHLYLLRGKGITQPAKTQGDLLPAELTNLQMDFKHIISQNTQEGSEQLMEEFLHRWKEYPSLIQYIQRQWLKEIQGVTLINDETSVITESEVEIWHIKLEQCLLHLGTQPELDGWVSALFAGIERSYYDDEIEKRRVNEARK